MPWRVRHRLEQWVESKAYDRHPGLYRWLHFGRRADPLVALTSGPRHHFFGYYDKTPWNGSGRLLLGHEAGFNDRAPTADDSVGIGVVDIGGGFEPLASSRAWNWQQGAMLQWLPSRPDSVFVHNDRRDGRFVAVLRDVAKGEIGVVDRPVYSILPDGRPTADQSASAVAITKSPWWSFERTSTRMFPADVKSTSKLFSSAISS